jgi:hypothetical protein
MNTIVDCFLNYIKITLTLSHTTELIIDFISLLKHPPLKSIVEGSFSISVSYKLLHGLGNPYK